MTNDRDARQLSDRELLLQTHQRVELMFSALYGNGQPGLRDRVIRLEERQNTPSKTGIAGLLAAIALALYEAKMRMGG